jgi:hypothetical protein
LGPSVVLSARQGLFCGTASTLLEPMSSLQTDLGSSSHWAATFTDNNNLLSTDPRVNPDFFNYTFVYIPYCGGDVHSGMSTTPNSWCAIGASLFILCSPHLLFVRCLCRGYYFSGHNTVDAVVRTLMQGTLSSATEVLISGSSAGTLLILRLAC